MLPYRRLGTPAAPAMAFPPGDTGNQPQPPGLDHPAVRRQQGADDCCQEGGRVYHTRDSMVPPRNPGSGRAGAGEPSKGLQRPLDGGAPVSYTHLTLPTIYSV